MRFDPKTLSLAACGSIFLAPLLLESIFSGRWPFIVLAVISAHLILRKPPYILNNINPGTLLYWLLAALLALASYFLEIDKALYLAGATLVGGSLLHSTRRPPLDKAATLICIFAFVPIPAGLESALANTLSNAEAAIFVALGQLGGQPLYQVGSQVVLGKLSVTINSDCSGTLLLLPSLLGCLVGASNCQRPTSFAFFIILAALPLAILVNLARIAFLLCIGLYSPETPLDEIHDALGWITMSMVWVLPVYFFTSRFTEESNATNSGLQYTATSLTVAVALFALSSNSYPKDQIERAPLPLYVDGWVGEDLIIPPEELRILNADSAVRRQYTNPNGDRTLLVTEIFHFKTSDAEEHSSAACFRAMGWQATILGQENITNNSTLEHLLVRNHVGQQAIFEVTINMNQKGRENGHVRLQIVEASTVPQPRRRETALTFLKAVQQKRSKKT